MRTSILLRAMLLSSLTAGASCAGMQRAPGGRRQVLPREMLSAKSDAPALYLGTSPNAPVVGFLDADVLLEVVGNSVSGRVPVRVHGALEVNAYVPESLLRLRAQRHGKLRGTPVYLGPGDPVLVVGDGEKSERLRVRAEPRMGTLKLPPFEGTYPSKGLAARSPEAADGPPDGEVYTVPANVALDLHDVPDGKIVAQIPAQTEPVEARVLGLEGDWYAVRVGDGPYLVGYTNAPIVKRESEAPSAPEPDPDVALKAPDGAMPARIARGAGERNRVSAGAVISFGGKNIARLEKPGFARVLAVYPDGQADALVAVDNEVAVRGLLRTEDLTDASVSEAQALLRRAQ